MSCPGNIAAVVKAIRKNKRDIYENDKLISMAAGTDYIWSNYLAGPKTQAIVAAANTKLVIHDLQLISAGQNSKKWLVVGYAESHRHKARKCLEKADAAMRNAFEHMLEVVRYAHTPDDMRTDAEAWIILFEEVTENSE